MDIVFKDIKNYLGYTLPIVLFIAFLIIMYRIYILIKYNKKINFIKELPIFLFIIYILCLFQIVTIKDTNNPGMNITFFQELTRYEFGSNLFFHNIIGNIVMFLPFGFFISYILKFKRAFFPIIFSAITSTIIEFIQLSIGRTFDVDDIILNVIGGLIGYLIYKLLNLILKKFKRKENIITLLLIIFVIVLFILVL